MPPRACRSTKWINVPKTLLNRILWHALKGSQAPYPAWAVSQVRDDD